MKVEHLTFTRFVAAILVVLYHIGASSLDPTSLLGSLLGVGDGAVSYFFALSGFILVVSNVRGGQLPTRIPTGVFWRNRFARIYPLYLFALALSLLSVFTNTDKLSEVSLGSVVASSLLVQAWLPQFVMQLNYPGWSLSVETLFYLLFPFLFALVIRQSTRRVVLMTGLFWVLSQLIHVSMVDQHALHNLALYFPLMHLNTFLVGVATGIIFIRHQVWLVQHRRWVTLAFAVLLAGSLWIVVGHLPLLKYHHNGLFAPLFAVFIVWLSMQTNGLARWLSRPLPVLLGEISYGIYLLQVPVGIITFYLNYNLLHWPVWLYVPAYLLVLSAISAGCYHGIEQPARRFIRQWATPVLSTSADEQFSRPA